MKTNLIMFITSIYTFAIVFFAPKRDNSEVFLAMVLVFLSLIVLTIVVIDTIKEHKKLLKANVKYFSSWEDFKSLSGMCIPGLLISSGISGFSYCFYVIYQEPITKTILSMMTGLTGMIVFILFSNYIIATVRIVLRYRRTV